MAISERQPRVFTPDDYLAFERAVDSKNEWLDGQIFAMSGGSPTHSTINGNVYGELYRHLKGRNCQYFESNMKVRTPLLKDSKQGLFTYPDASVVCRAQFFHDLKKDVLVNPRVIFEVLSPSTEDYDRGEKRRRYLAIPSLIDYVMVAQDRPLVEQWTRDPEGKWTVSTLDDLSATLVLPSIDCRLALSDIYDRVAW